METKLTKNHKFAISLIKQTRYSSVQLENIMLKSPLEHWEKCSAWLRRRRGGVGFPLKFCEWKEIKEGAGIQFLDHFSFLNLWNVDSYEPYSIFRKFLAWQWRYISELSSKNVKDSSMNCTLWSRPVSINFKTGSSSVGQLSSMKTYCTGSSGFALKINSN